MSATALVVEVEEFRWELSGELAPAEALERLRKEGCPRILQHRHNCYSPEHWLIVALHAVARSYAMDWNAILQDYFARYGWPPQPS